MKKAILSLLVAVAVSGCSKYPDGTSVWGGGMFLAFWIPLIGSFILAYFGYQSWKSGTITGGSYNNPEIVESKERLKPWKVWQWVFAAVLFIGSIIVLISTNAGK